MVSEIAVSMTAERDKTKNVSIFWSAYCPELQSGNSRAATTRCQKFSIQL